MSSYPFSNILDRASFALLRKLAKVGAPPETEVPAPKKNTSVGGYGGYGLSVDGAMSIVQAGGRLFIFFHGKSTPIPQTRHVDHIASCTVVSISATILKLTDLHVPTATCRIMSASTDETRPSPSISALSSRSPRTAIWSAMAASAVVI